MKIIYTPNRAWHQVAPRIDQESTYLSLSGNNWDDYGYKTTLHAKLFFDKQEVELDFSIKILVEGEDYTTSYLNKLCDEGWNGEFPIPNTEYISLPTDIDFYKIIKSKIDELETKSLLQSLRDSGFLIHIENDEASIGLSKTDAFSISLLREGGSNKCYQDGWRLFVPDDDSNIRDFELNLQTKDRLVRVVPFCFESNLLPYDINVIIGPNGIGKSYCLRSLVEYWLKVGMGDKEALEEQGHEPFDTRPNISRLILVSYSPFEEFSLGLEEKDHVIDKSAYRYFGFRQLREDGTVGISRGLPKVNASHSLIDALYEDHKFSDESWWVNKLEACDLVLKKALGYDYLAIEVNSEQVNDEMLPLLESVSLKKYLKLDSSIAELSDIETLKNICNLSEGIQFIKDGEVCKLSSGQRLFSYIVINVVGSIRENSLIVIDEPELFLHPTLEIEFISLLKAILKPFKSKAVLATHSLSVVREVPSKCVHIFRDDEGGLDIVPPPFETFGGSVQRISSYVFGDRAVTKPFDEWLVEKMNEDADAEKLIESLGDEINEELQMKIARLGRKINGG